MESVDQQVRQLKENYQQMTEGELCAVAENAYDLTEIAREALQAVISERSLGIQLAAAPVPDELSDEAGSRDDERDDELVCVRTLHSESEAKEAKAVLDGNFIASCLGPENIVDLEDFKGRFEGGVGLKVFAGDAGRASKALSFYAPQEEEGAENLEEEAKKYAITCPKCNSEEIIFERQVPQVKTRPTRPRLTGVAVIVAISGRTRASHTLCRFGSCWIDS
jgi:hypothetical protein